MQVYHHLKTETCFDSKYKKQHTFGDPRSAATVEPLNSCVSNISQSTKSENIPGILWGQMEIGGGPLMASFSLAFYLLYSLLNKLSIIDLVYCNINI